MKENFARAFSEPGNQGPGAVLSFIWSEKTAPIDAFR